MVWYQPFVGAGLEALRGLAQAGATSELAERRKEAQSIPSDGDCMREDRRAPSARGLVGSIGRVVAALN